MFDLVSDLRPTPGQRAPGGAGVCRKVAWEDFLEDMVLRVGRMNPILLDLFSLLRISRVGVLLRVVDLPLDIQVQGFRLHCWLLGNCRKRQEE